MEYDGLSASDGTGEPIIANIEADRIIGSTSLNVDSVENFPATFIGATGTLDANDFIDPSTMTILYGHTDAGNVVIDGFAPGYADDGNTEGQVLIIKPTTFWADEIVRLARVAHNDDGTLRGGVLENIRQYTANDTWNKPANLKFVIVEVQAGGGGSGGRAATGAAQHGPAGGGGGGEYARKKILAADLGATEAITVGAGGAGGASGANTGGTGGTSSFGSHVAAAGGSGGGGNGPTGNLGQGAAGGAGGTGGAGSADLRIPGGDGGYSITFSDVRGLGGFGGASRLGGSIKGQQNTSTSSGGPGSVGKLYGGGASGGHNSASTSAAAGQAGGAGIVIVHEYFD